MKITKKYCPHCGKLYNRYTNYDGIQTGCPIVTCPNCQAEFLDKDIKEDAFYSPPKPSNLFRAIMTPLYPWGIAGILFLICGFMVEDESLSTVSLIVAFLSLVGYAYIVYICIKKKDKIYNDMLNDYNRSKERLSNKDYVISLIELGYRVPKSFLTNNYPDLLNYKKTNKRS